jgi:GNAT superfamily N-acetyltransferase
LWQYKNNPTGCIISVAWCDGKIVGVFPTTSLRIKVGNLTVYGVEGTDTVVDPSYRRKGIFVSMGASLRKVAKDHNIGLFFAFPREASYKGVLKFGGFDICEALLFARFSNLHNASSLLSLRFKSLYLRRRIPKYIMSLLVLLLSTLRWSPSILKVPMYKENDASIRLREIRVFDKEFEDFWKEVSRGYSMIIVRDQDYLNWRFVERPAAGYRVFKCERNGKVIGYVTLTSKSSGVHRLGYIVDLLCPANDTAVFERLVSFAINFFKTEHADLIVCLVTKHGAYSQLLKQLGFFHVSSAKVVGEAYNSLVLREVRRNGSRWYLTLSDTDWI